MQTIRRIFNERIHVFLFIIPAIYFIIGSYFRYILSDISLRSLDPDYIYFITGLSISEGHLNVAHVDNPGTPLQYLIGLTDRIVYLLKPENGGYLEDIFKNPDLYMAVSNSVITGITAAFLCYAGYRVFKATGSILYGLLIQTTPFLAVIWYDLIGRIVPELLIPIPIMLLGIFLIESIYSDKKITGIKSILILSAISGFGLSIKLTFIPLWFIPFLIIKNWKEKLLFILFSILFFLFFALPVTLRIGIFTSWIKSLFIHSGQYGGGDSNFINWTEFWANLQFLWGYEKWFLVATFATILTALGYLLFKRKEADKQLLLITAAVLGSIVLQTIMVGKHFEHRYYIPALLMFPLLIFLIAEIARRMLKNQLQILISIGLIIFLFAHFSHQEPWLKLKAETMSMDMAQRQETRSFVSTLNPNNIKIISTQNYGSPFKEYALMISYAWSGSHQKYYTDALAKLYPDTYLFFSWDNTFRYWGTELSFAKINDSKKPVYLYLENETPELYKRTIDQLKFVSDTVSVTPELLFQNEKTKEVIYQLNFEVIKQLENNR